MATSTAKNKAVKPATQSAPSKEKAATKPVQSTEKQPRKLKPKRHRIRRYKNKPAVPAIPPARTLMRAAFTTIAQNKKLLGGVILIYGLLLVVLAQISIGQDFSSARELLAGTSNTTWSNFVSSLLLFSYLTGSGGKATTAAGGVYQFLLVIVVSLALIWALRHIYASSKVRIRDTYYRGMYPLVPFILVLLVILLQTVPLVIGLWVYNVVMSSGIAVSIFEQVFWLLVTGILVFLTLRWVCSSIIALYVVTLPDMEPIKALRSARNLVRYRRVQVFWRIFALVLMLLFWFGLFLVPVIMVVPVLAPWLFYVLSVMAIAVVHAYMYGLYRELLHE